MLTGKVLITRPLGDQPKRLVRKDTDLTGTILDPEMKPGGGRIRLPCPVINYLGRDELFGSKEPASYSAEGLPRKYWTRKILVPWMENFEVVDGKPVLHMIQLRADNVLRLCEALRAGRAEPKDLQASVNRYYDEVQETLTGKSGLLTRHVFGVRCRQSLRCVMVPDPDLHYWEAGVPAIPALKAGIDNGDWVIAVRSPILWQGSVLVMKARLVQGNAGRVGPHVMAGLGLDFDGDQMAFYRVPIEEQPEVQQELTDAVGDPTIETFKWDGEFLVNNPEPEPSWPLMKLELATRLSVTGLSMGPEDVLDPEKSEFLQTAARGSALPEDIKSYAKGLKIRDWAREAENSAVEIARMKLEVGLLGAVTDRMNQVLLAFNRELLPIGLQMKEKMTDLMMKCAKAGGGTGYSTQKVAEMIDRKGKFELASAESALDYLEEIGFDRDKHRPLVELLYDLGGAGIATRQHLALLQACRQSDRASLAEVLRGHWGFGSIAARIHEMYGEESADEDRGLLPYPGIQASGSLIEQP